MKYLFSIIILHCIQLVAIAQDLRHLNYNKNLPVHQITRLLPIRELIMHLNNLEQLNNNWEEHLYVELYANTIESDTQRTFLFRNENSGYDGLINNIFLTKLFGNDSICIYRFGEGSPHAYWYLLLKDKNEYRILNCSNFLDDFNYIDSILKKAKDIISYDNIENIISNYYHNENYHPTPPFPNLRNKTKELNQKPNYPARQVVETKPFIFIGN